MKSTMKENYTPEMHNLIYTAAKAVFEQGKDPNEFLTTCERMGINQRSFLGWFVPAYRYMRTGKTLKGNIPQSIRRYMLERILNEYGHEGLLLALKSYIGTVEYYELKGVNKTGDREIIEEFQKILGFDSSK